MKLAGLGGRKRERDAGAAAGTVLSPDPSTLRLHEAARDGKAEPGAPARAGPVRAPEALERADERVGSETLTGVLDRDDDLVLVRLGQYGYGAVRRCVPQGVGDEVVEDTLDLVRCAAGA